MIGIAIGVIGIIISVVVAFLVKPRPRLATQINTLELVGPNAVLPDEIQFLFRGDPVPKVTMSRIAIWNVGNRTIQKAQVVEKDPLRITISEGSNILEPKVLKRTRDVNGVDCVVKDKPNEAEFTFDYLDPKDGALVQLIHTGDDKVSVVGTLRGITNLF